MTLSSLLLPPLPPPPLAPSSQSKDEESAKRMMVALGKVLQRWDYKGRKEKAENFQHSLSTLGAGYESSRFGKTWSVPSDCVYTPKTFCNICWKLSFDRQISMWGNLICLLTCPVYMPCLYFSVNHLPVLYCSTGQVQHRC